MERQGRRQPPLALAYPNSPSQRAWPRALINRAAETVPTRKLDGKLLLSELIDTRNWLTHRATAAIRS
jgi:hypothetical protein